ncbi:MAG: hypothetical protein LRY40_06695 [Shewanella fodinae]|nr:hypothetical protein [Shewanella fodinae]
MENINVLLLCMFFILLTIPRQPPIKLGQLGEELFAAGNAILVCHPSRRKKSCLLILNVTWAQAARRCKMLWLAEKLVKNGYLVVGINHHGNTAIEPKTYAEGFVLWWERSRDVAVVLEQISNDKKWSPYIDPTNIGMLGFFVGWIHDHCRYRRHHRQGPIHEILQQR